MKMDQLLEQVERELSRKPEMLPAPSGLRGRVMEEVAVRVPRRERMRIGRVIGPAALAASVALAGLVWLQWGGEGAMEPAREDVVVAVVESASEEPRLLIEAQEERRAAAPAPIIRPAALYVAERLERPVRTEGRMMLEDTRRAADFVVSCLPFTGG